MVKDDLLSKTKCIVSKVTESCKRKMTTQTFLLTGNLTQQLEENLGQLQVVTGYLKVYGSDTLFSLNFLSNLEEIGGKELVHGR